MISHRKSLRPKSVILLIAFLLSSCTLKTRNDIEGQQVSTTQNDEGSGAEGETASNKVASPLEEYSLKKDRSHLDELRKSIPESVKQKNDELALVLGLMKGFDIHPSKIRSRFDRILRKKRTAANKKMRREREDFNKSERSQRDKFLAEIKKQRKDFNRSKADQETRKRFNQDYREKRDDFFNSAREKRLAQEADWREQRREFESYIREKRSEFSDEMRSYSKRYYDYKKNKKLKKKTDRKAKRLQRKKRSYSPGDMFSSQGQRQGSGQSQQSSSTDDEGGYNSPAYPLQPDDPPEEQ